MSKPVDKTKENLIKCKCKFCPSYGIKCKLKEMPHDILEVVEHFSDVSKAGHIDCLFCAFGKSECITEEKGCKCGECEVFKEYELDSTYYCLKDIK